MEDNKTKDKIHVKCADCKFPQPSGVFISLLFICCLRVILCFLLYLQGLNLISMAPYGNINLVVKQPWAYEGNYPQDENQIEKIFVETHKEINEKMHWTPILRLPQQQLVCESLVPGIWDVGAKPIICPRHDSEKWLISNVLRGCGRDEVFPNPWIVTLLKIMMVMVRKASETLYNQCTIILSFHLLYSWASIAAIPHKLGFS